MKKIMLFVVGIFVLSLIASTSMAATADGMSGVPWGVNRKQVAKAMQERGFSLAGNKFVTALSTTAYVGEFADQSPATLKFIFKGNSFHTGVAIMCITGLNTGHSSVQACGQKMESLIREKYGEPRRRLEAKGSDYYLTMSDPPPGVLNSALMNADVSLVFWESISNNSTGTDNITVTLCISQPDPQNGGFVEVSYINNSLLQRLKQSTKSDI